MTTRRHRSQQGFTLVELLVASVISVVVLGALGSMVWVTYGAVNTWDPRLGATAEVRNIQLAVYDDVVETNFADAQTNAKSCDPTAPCSRPLVLGQLQYVPASQAAAARSVTYCLNGTVVMRSVTKPLPNQSDCGAGGATWVSVAHDIASWSWYYDDGTKATTVCPPAPAPPAGFNSRDGCIVIKVGASVLGYTTYQTMLFLPRIYPAPQGL